MNEQRSQGREIDWPKDPAEFPFSRMFSSVFPRSGRSSFDEDVISNGALSVATKGELSGFRVMDQDGAVAFSGVVIAVLSLAVRAMALADSVQAHGDFVSGVSPRFQLEGRLVVSEESELGQLLEGGIERGVADSFGHGSGDLGIFRREDPRENLVARVNVADQGQVQPIDRCYGDCVGEIFFVIESDFFAFERPLRANLFVSVCARFR